MRFVIVVGVLDVEVDGLEPRAVDLREPEEGGELGERGVCAAEPEDKALEGAALGGVLEWAGDGCVASASAIRYYYQVVKDGEEYVLREALSGLDYAVDKAEIYKKKIEC